MFSLRAAHRITGTRREKKLFAANNKPLLSRARHDLLLTTSLFYHARAMITSPMTPQLLVMVASHHN